MPNRFGVRHALLALLLLGLGVSVWLNMLQLDRVWARMGEIKAAQARLEESIVRLERASTNPVPAAPTPHAAASANPTAPPEIVAMAFPDWGRPGVPARGTEQPFPVRLGSVSADGAIGGTVTEGLELDVEYITPYRGTSAVTRRVLELVQERLADYNPIARRMWGVLAEGWQMDPAGLWLRVKIRDDANWSDGVPVTAGDIKFTIDLIRNPAYGATRFQSQFEAISEVRVISPKVAEFVFKDVLYTNEDATLRMVPIPAHVYAKLTPEQFIASSGLLVGSGPFMLASSSIDHQWTPGNPIELVRNPRWRGAARPLDGYRFIVTKAPAARLAAIRNGEVDLVRGTSELAAAVGTDKEKPPYAVVWTPVTAGPVAIVWNCGKRPDGTTGPTGQRKVRNALTHALDRWKMNADLFAGGGVVCSGPFPADSPSNNPDVSPIPYSIDRANALLDEAGLKRGDGGKRQDASGKPVTMRIIGQREMANAESWSAYLRDQFAALGIDCTVELVDNAVYTSTTKSRDFDGVIAAWAPDSPEPNIHQRYHSSNIANRGDNDAQWNNAEADRLIDEARRTLDPAKRAELWRRFHALLNAEQPHTFIVFRPMVMLVSGRLGNFVPTMMGVDRTSFYIRKQATSQPPSGGR
jgi:peptide/nickel transport system substrate-binding protein